ncbi:MAG: DUF58 domain-containing protein, partial [Thermodesulfobacteriota bacterium]
MIRRLLHFTYRRFWKIKTLLFRRFTSAGLLALAALAVSSVFGLDTTRTMAFQAFCFLLALLVLAVAAGLSQHLRLGVTRLLPRFATVDRPFTYRILIENRGPRPQTGLTALEDLGDPRPSLEELVSAREPGEAGRHRLDRYFGYYRWLWLLSRKQPAAVREQAVPLLPPRGRAELSAELVPRRRGLLHLNRLLIRKTEPLGLFRTVTAVETADRVTVLPKRYRVPELDLPGNRHYQPGGVALASNVGDSEEFISLRDYRPGDPLRRIHWKSWAKTVRPIVKEHQDEFFVRHALVLDTFQKPGGVEEVFE